MANPAATGSRTLFGLGLGRPETSVAGYGIPAPSLIGYNVILPLEGVLGNAENPSGEVNPSGFRRAGVPGPRGGPFANLGIPMNTSNLLELFWHLLGSVTKDEPQTDVFTYTFVPDLDGPGATSHFTALAGSPPVSLWWLYGIMFGQLNMEIGDNTPIIPRLTGEIQHGTYLGAAVPSVSNTGTYTLGPWLRGLIADPDGGSVWVRITSVSPLEFKVIQSVAEPDGPAWTAAATTFTALLDADGESVWQNVQSSEDDLDLGVWGENKDPLEIVIPGAAADHADLAVDDTFEFPLAGDWVAPALTAMSGQRFTSAHWVTRFRAIGAGTWDTRAVRTGSIGLGLPVTAERGNTSRYPHQILRSGEVTATATFARAFIDTFFRDAMDRHDRLEMQLAFEGRQLGDGSLREGAELTYPAAALTERASNPGDAGIVPETGTLTAETNDAGDPPVTVVVTTERDWTPPA